MNEIWCWSWVLGVTTEIECKLEKPGLVVRVDCPSSPALVAAQLTVIQVVGSASRDGALADYRFVFSARLRFHLPPGQHGYPRFRCMSLFGCMCRLTIKAQQIKCGRDFIQHLCLHYIMAQRNGQAYRVAKKDEPAVALW